MPYIGKGPADIIATAIDTTTGTFSGAVSAASVDADGGVTVDNITIDGTEIDLSSGDLTIDSAGQLVLDYGSGAIITKAGGTEIGKIHNSSTDFVIESTTSDKDILFKGNDGGSTITALTLDMSLGGDATFNARGVFNSNVSIGTTSFTSKFTVSNAGTDNVIETANSSNSVRGGMQADTSVVGMGALTNHILAFRVNNSEVARLDTGGHFMLNTTTERNSGNLSIDFDGSSQGAQGLNVSSSGIGSVFIGFLTGGTFRGSITNNNNSAVAFNTTSDYRLKENVSYSFDATTRLKQLKPARFNWIADDTNTSQDGFLAHEVSSVVPEAITGTKDEMKTTKNVVLDVDENIIARGVTEDEWISGKEPDSTGKSTYAENTSWKSTITQKHYQQIDHSKLVPLLTKALQEQQATIEALTARIVTLENA